MQDWGKKSLRSWLRIMNNLDIKSDYNRFKEAFSEENSRMNLVSKNDEKFLYEKHFYDSLAIKYFFDKYDFYPHSILDIGTGGGFPSVPIAMEYPAVSVTGLDSIAKKIKAVERIRDRLGIKNLSLINDRAENIKNNEYDLIVSRAVGKVSKIIEYAYPLLKSEGYLVLYKSKTINDEIGDAKNLIRKYQLKILPILEYKLPLEENYTRALVIFKKRGKND